MDADDKNFLENFPPKENFKRTGVMNDEYLETSKHNQQVTPEICGYQHSPFQVNKEFLFNSGQINLYYHANSSLHSDIKMPLILNEQCQLKSNLNSQNQRKEKKSLRKIGDKDYLGETLISEYTINNGSDKLSNSSDDFQIDQIEKSVAKNEKIEDKIGLSGRNGNNLYIANVDIQNNKHSENDLNNNHSQADDLRCSDLTALRIKKEKELSKPVKLLN